MYTPCRQSSLISGKMFIQFTANTTHFLINFLAGTIVTVII